MRRQALAILSIVADLTAIFGIAALVWNNIIEPKYFPSVTIECPPQIYSHEHVVFGHHIPKSLDYKVQLYVYPEDKTYKYWLQEGRWESHLPGTWADWARFGNPWGRDMVIPPPLNFRVFAVLIKSTNVVNLPGVDSRQPWVETIGHVAFVKLVKEKGAIAVNSCHLTRLPENGCTMAPTITSPQNQKVTSPVLLQWEPDMKMYVEIWKGGTIFKGGEMENNTEQPLDTGTYELRVRPRAGFQCLSSMWIDVVGK